MIPSLNLLYCPQSVHMVWVGYHSFQGPHLVDTPAKWILVTKELQFPNGVACQCKFSAAIQLSSPGLLDSTD